MSRQIRLELIRLQVPDLSRYESIELEGGKGSREQKQTLSVLSLLALTNNLESALHANRYTAAT